MGSKQSNEALQEQAQATINTPEYKEMLNLIQKSQARGVFFDENDQKRLDELIKKFIYFNNDQRGGYVHQECSCNQGDWKDKPPIIEAIDSKEVLEKLSNAKSPSDIIELAQQDIEKRKNSYFFKERHQLAEYWNIANQAGDVELACMIEAAMRKLRGDRPTPQHRISPHALYSWGA